MDDIKERKLASWRRWYAKNRERQAAYLKKWNAENADKAKAIRARYYQAHREQIRAQQKEYNKTHKADPKKAAENSRRSRERRRDEIGRKERERRATDKEYRARRNEACRVSRLRHLDEAVERERKYRETNRALLCERTRKRYAKDLERSRAKSREQNKKHAEYRKKYQREWIKKNPDRVSHHCKTRRARRNGAEGTFTPEEWRALLTRYNHKCAYCGDSISGRNASQDHKIPLIRGGAHRADNILPACRSCNSKKGTLTHEEYLSRQTSFGR